MRCSARSAMMGRSEPTVRARTGIPVCWYRAAALLVPDEPDQVLRPARFRQEHPDVIIGTGEFGTWQARTP
jgi:hypothetical protein